MHVLTGVNHWMEGAPQQEVHCRCTTGSLQDIETLCVAITATVTVRDIGRWEKSWSQLNQPANAVLHIPEVQQIGPLHQKSVRQLLWSKADNPFECQLRQP